MTIVDKFVSKLIVAFVTIAMLFSLSYASTAHAATEAELQAQIDVLIAQLAALTGQVSAPAASASSSVCPYTWTRSLSVGDSGPDVMKLQQFLNSNDATRVAASGIGSAGQETDYYGGLTGEAVKKYQTMYSAQILAPLGLVNPTPYFGNSTRGHMNGMCTSAPTTGGDDDHDHGSDDDGSDDDDDDSSSSSSALSGGEADVNSVDASDEEDEITEGQEDVAVISVEFDVEDGDVRLERVDVRLDGASISGDAEADPWDAFEDMSIWVDGDKVASEDVTDEDDWDESGTEYEFRLTNVDSVFREDTTNEIIVALSAQNGVDVDSTGSNNNWVIDIPQNGLRFVDSEGLDILAPSAGAGTDNSTFEMQDEGANDDLDLESSDDDPDSDTLALDEDDNQEYAIFAFDLSAEDSDNDISIDQLYVNVLVGGGSTTDDVVDDFRLELDGESFDAESYTGSTASVEDIEFDIDGDVEVPADGVITAILYAEFNDQESFGSATIVASTSPSTIDSEGADDIAGGDVGGSVVTGETHTLRLNGVDADFVDEDATEKENDDATNADDQGAFTLEFDITAFGDDIFIPFGATSTTDLNDGFEFSILDNNNSLVAATSAQLTISVDVDDGDTEETNSYKIDEGETNTFTLEVTFDPISSDSFKVRLDTVNFALTDVATATNAQDVSDLDIDTRKLTVQN